MNDRQKEFNSSFKKIKELSDKYDMGISVSEIVSTLIQLGDKRSAEEIKKDLKKILSKLIKPKK